MTYYKTNGVYKMLERADSHPFRWVAGNAWTLIYGDNQSNPLVCALVAGKSWSFQKEIFSLVKRISEVAGLPMVYIEFDDQRSEIEEVEASVNGSDLKKYELHNLRDLFSSFGLPVKSGKVSKAINDASSSAYHNWQRRNLGNISVSDIDLFRKSTESVPAEIIELKRSYISLERWKPFPVDYTNFNLLLSVAKLCSLEFSIAYNVRHKNPFYDDASMLSVFRYSERGFPKYIGVFNADDFIRGEYHLH